jgi:virginiamycin B lyase
MRRMTVILLITIVSGLTFLIQAAGSPALAADSPAAALTGQVSSTEEGPMEGVTVSAKRDGSTITLTVITNEQGRYSFPRNRLEPGQYTLRIRAAGYELEAPASTPVTADKTATADLKLRKTQDISQQLTNTEWLWSMPGTDDDKHRMQQCGNCHTYQRIVRSQYDTAGFMDILQLMASFTPGSTPAHPQKKGIEGGDVMAPGVVSEATARYLSTVNLSTVDHWAYPLQMLPRAKGRSTHVIITEYDLPRREALPHDVLLGKDGLIWYRDFGTEFIGSLDPKTGKVVDYPMPPLKPGFAGGMIDLQMDKDGNLWTGYRQAAILKFDPRTHKYTACCGDEDASQKDPNLRADFGIVGLVYGPDNKPVKVWGGGGSMPGIHRLDLATGKLEEFFKNPVYGINADSKGNGYGLQMANQNIIKVDAATGELTILPTPTKNSGPRRGQFDDQDRLWFAEFKADKIGMLDTRTGTFKEFPLPTKWTGPYDVALDKNSEAWTGGMFSDRLVRLDTKTGKAVEYQMPRNTNMRRMYIDNSTTPVTLWVGNNHGDSIVKVEPLD